MIVATRTWLVAVVLFVGMASVTAQKKCSATQTTACMSCSEVGTCNADRTLSLTTTCSESQVCREYSSTAACVPASNTNVCNNCGSQPIGCDPYNPLIVHVCNPGMAPLELEKCTVTQTCSAGACVNGTSDPNTPAAVCARNDAIPSKKQFYSLKPACTSGVLCSGTNVTLIFNCTSGNYFNQILKSCKSLPVNHCNGVTTDGFSAHLTNCSKAVVCQGGTVVDEIECGADMAFSMNGGCTARTNSTICPLMDGCALASIDPVTTTSSTRQSSSTTTTTTTTSTGNGSSSTTTRPTPSSTTTVKPPVCSASNLNKRYPHETKCERYYTCRLISGIYKYVELICSGAMVYNPTTTYCETPTPPSCRTSRNDAA